MTNSDKGMFNKFCNTINEKQCHVFYSVLPSSFSGCWLPLEFHSFLTFYWFLVDFPSYIPIFLTSLSLHFHPLPLQPETKFKNKNKIIKIKTHKKAKKRKQKFGMEAIVWLSLSHSPYIFTYEASLLWAIGMGWGLWLLTPQYWAFIGTPLGYPVILCCWDSAVSYL